MIKLKKGSGLDVHSLFLVYTKMVQERGFFRPGKAVEG